MPDSAPGGGGSLNPMSGPGDSRPVPDPTLLTTEALRREVQMLRELLETRLDGMDKAMTVFRENIIRVPTDVDKQVGHLKELHNEKFAGVQKQFDERDARIEQTSRDSKTAVDAALQAAKEAVGQQTQSSAQAIAKSETATTKQLDQLSVQIMTVEKSLNDKNADLKDRLTAMENRTVGVSAATSSARQDNSWALAVVLGLFSLIGLVVAVISLVTR